MSRHGTAYDTSPNEPSTVAAPDQTLDVAVPVDANTCTAPGYGFQVDMTFRTARLGKRIVEVPITFVERELGVDPVDFRLWVCLHEETHRVQFTAVPWLRGYLNAQIAEIVATADLDGAALARLVV